MRHNSPESFTVQPLARLSLNNHAPCLPVFCPMCLLRICLPKLWFQWELSYDLDKHNLISNWQIPINYENEPKIYGIRSKNRGNAPKNHGNWPINRGKPCINIIRLVASKKLKLLPCMIYALSSQSRMLLGKRCACLNRTITPTETKVSEDRFAEGTLGRKQSNRERDY